MKSRNLAAPIAVVVTMYGGACRHSVDRPPADTTLSPTDTDVGADTDDPHLRVAIEPSAPAFDDDLHCRFGVPDPAAAYTIAWTVDGAVYAGPTARDLVDGDTIPNLAQAGAQIWTCSVTSTLADIVTQGASAAVIIGTPVRMVEIASASVTYAWGITTWRGTYSLTRPYLLGIYEVTNEEFVRFLGRRGRDTFAGANLPVVSSTLHDAAEFVNALSTADGLDSCYACTTTVDGLRCTRPADLYGCKGYRLPSDVEWLIAATEGATHHDMLPAGGNFTIHCALGDPCGGWPMDPAATGPHAPPGTTVGDQCVYAANPYVSDAGPLPVGSRIPNRLGLYDMCGNVEERLADARYVPDNAPPLVDMYAAGGPDTTQSLTRSSTFMAYEGVTIQYTGEAADLGPGCGLRVARTR